MEPVGVGPERVEQARPRITDIDGVQLPVRDGEEGVVFPFDFSRSGSSTPFSWTFVPE